MFSKVIIPIYTPTNIPFAPYPPNICTIRFKIFAQYGECDYNFMSLVIIEVEHIFLWLLTVWIFFSVICLIFSSIWQHFKMRTNFTFLLVFCSFIFVKLYRFLDYFFYMYFRLVLSYYNTTWEWNAVFFGMVQNKL